MTFSTVMLDVAVTDNQGQEKVQQFLQSYHIICDVSKG